MVLVPTVLLPLSKAVPPLVVAVKAAAKLPNLTPLQITAAAATGIGPSSRKKAHAVGGNTDGVVQALYSMLSMSTTTRAQGKVATVENGHVIRKHMSKDKDKSANIVQ